MNRQIISFKANEQRLIKNERVSRYSSNKVAYVEAHFELGENWTGYDSVRAVWFTESVAGISTVLGRGGVCTVPTEVLKHRGKVYVNLVGSIAEGNALTDRLTTYPIVALTVDADSVVDGTETEPVTPSQFEQFVEAVRDDADRAEAGAETAGSEADRSAQSATESASSASASAGSAQSASESAVRAETARDEAESARDEILGMRAEATTLEAGSDATASYSDGLLTLGIPRGDRGATGEKGDKGDRGETGQTGPAGADGFSPIVAVTSITGGHEVSIEDAEQTQTFDVMDGTTPVIPWDDILPIDTASGDIASFPDGSELVPARSVKVELEPIQDLHGYDKPWSGGNGKNKLNLVSVFNGSGSYSADGSVYTLDSIGVRPLVQFAETDGNYILTWDNAAYGGTATDVRLEFYNSDGAFVTSRYCTEATPYALNGVCKVQANYGANGSLTIKNPMIRLATETDATFAPYSNICPIYGRTECVTERTGRNIFGGEVLRDGVLASMPSATDDAENRYVSFTATATVSQYITVGTPFKENTAYTFILDLYCTTTNTNLRVLYTDGTRGNIPTVTANTRTKVVFVSDATKTIDSLVKSNQSGVTRIYYDESGVFEGVLTADQFEAFDGHTYTTALGRTVYGGEVEQVGGSLTDKYAMLDLGTLNWAYRTSGSFVTPYFNTNVRSFKRLGPFGTTVHNLVCSQYKTVARNATDFVNGTICADGDANYVWEVQIKDDRFTDATAFKEAMSGVQLCYELATPQTYQLTPTEIDLLHGQNNLWSDGEIEVEYNADIQLYIEKKLG